MPITPPCSLSPPSAVRPLFPTSNTTTNTHNPNHPPSPPSSAHDVTTPRLTRSASDHSSTSAASRCAPVLPLITAVFPYAASSVASASHMLEIVTPPDHVLQGFIADDAELGRIMFVHLPPTHASAPARPDPLAPHFSDVLRPHDPRRAHPVPTKASPAPQALDIRESLTALLDLADTLDAAQLLLILDKDEREPQPLAQLMHALMYVGGQPVCPGVPVGEWEWDSQRWALVSIEL